MIPAAQLPDQLAPLGNAGDHFDITLSEIKTTTAAGLTNLYVEYYVPGYWSGEIVCQILKTPLIYYQSGNESRVGIGTSQPAGRLHVGNKNAEDELQLGLGKGSSNISSELWISKTDTSPNDFSGGSWLNLHNEQSTSTSGATISFSKAMAPGHQNFAPVAIRAFFPDVRTGGSSGELSIYTSVWGGLIKEALRIDCNGNLGIGVSAVKSKLAVAGGATIGDSYKAHTAPANGLLVEGKVGIGTPTVDYPLHIKTNGGYGLYHTDGTNDIGTWVGNEGNFHAGWLGTKSNVPLAFFTNNGGAQVVLNTSGTLDVKKNITIGGQPLSIAGSVKHGQWVYPPAGTTVDDWNIIVSIVEQGYLENENNGDNALLTIGCHAAVGDPPNGGDKAWQLWGIYTYRYGRHDDQVKQYWMGVQGPQGQDVQATLSYLLVRK